MSQGGNVDNTYRRKWNREEYLERAREAEKEVSIFAVLVGEVFMFCNSWRTDELIFWGLTSSYRWPWLSVLWQEEDEREGRKGERFSDNVYV